MIARAGPLASLVCLLATAAGAADPTAPTGPTGSVGQPPTGATGPTAGPAPDAPAPRPASPLEEVSGTVRAVDRQRHAVSIETASGPVEILLDRNTLVYQPGGATTVLSITPGAAVKSGVDPARRAYWVQVRPQAPAAAPAADPPPRAP